MNLKIITDSTCYFDDERLKKYDITKVNLTVNYNDQSFKENEITSAEIMDLMNQGVKVTSAQPTPEEYAKCFTKYAKHYDYLIVFTLPRTLSGSAQAASLGARIAKIDNLRIFAINKCAFGMENIIELVYDEIQKASSIEEIEDIVNKANSNGALCFKISNLMHLHNGGRLSGTVAVIGSLLKIKAIIGQHLDGTLHNDAKFRTDTKVINYMLEQISKTSMGYQKVYIKVIHIKEEANFQKLMDKIKEEFPKAILSSTKLLGPVFTVHLGDEGYGITVSCL